MADNVDTPVTRAELIEARGRISEQLDLLEYPARSSDRNPTLIARLRGMLKGIDDALADLPTDDS